MHKKAKALPPVLILHGDKDKVVPVKIARDLEKLLKDN
jgi:predicted esterase